VTFLTPPCQVILPFNAERLTACSVRRLYVRTVIQMTCERTLPIALSAWRSSLAMTLSFTSLR
jgi:hypothetical protein